LTIILCQNDLAGDVASWKIPDKLEDEISAWLSQQEVSAGETWLTNLKIDLPPDQLRELFDDQGKESYTTHIYTDGSLIDGQAGWGYYKGEQGEDDLTSPNGRGRVSGAQEVIRGELEGILEALDSEPRSANTTIAKQALQLLDAGRHHTQQERSHEKKTATSLYPS
jgi:hypothetical protein